MKSLRVKDCMHRGNNDYIRAAIQFIRNQYYTPVKVSDIAACVGINRSYLYTLFIQETGMSPNEYLSSFRLTRAAEMLNITGDSIEQIASSCGYQDAVVFSKAFKKKYGISPRQFRKNEAEKLKNSPI